MKTRTCGFTLIELMFAVLILAILTTIAAPNFISFVKTNRAESEIREVASALAFARSAAVSRGKPISVCRSNDNATCSGSWTDGWIVFIDNGTAGKVDGDDKVLRSGQGSGADTLKVYSYATSSTTTKTAEDYVQFDNRGTVDKRFNFVVCDSDNDTRYARAVLLGEIGRLLLSQSATYTGTHTDINNQALTCP